MNLGLAITTLPATGDFEPKGPISHNRFVISQCYTVYITSISIKIFVHFFYSFASTRLLQNLRLRIYFIL